MITDNSLLNGLKEATNYKYTENGAVAHKTTLDKVYDLFAFGGAYRSRRDDEIKLLFKEAYEQDKELALKCLFYLRDIRGGQGERKFFRLAYNWLCYNDPDVARKNLNLLSEYGRWDDLFCTIDTPLEKDALEIIKKQLHLDLDCKTPSLLAKWLPSENCSSVKTKKLGTRVRKYLKMSHKEYRKMLSQLREKINIVEKLMSANRWEEIVFDKIPSKAGLIYKNAFARRDLIAKKYKTFIENKSTKVNAAALYPYDVVRKVTCHLNYWSEPTIDEVDRVAIEKYWENLPNYIPENGNHNILCVCDTSGSMTGRYGTVAPIDVAISLSIYAAERLNGAFKNHYISFASRPQLIEISGIDFVNKVENIYKTNLVDDTNLEAVFDLLKKMVLSGKAQAKDLPSTICVISDMEINYGTCGAIDEDTMETEMERIRREWAAAGLEMPHLVYWNVAARNNTILDLGPNVSYVSGASPVLFEQICQGVTGMELMLKKLASDRYQAISI